MLNNFFPLISLIMKKMLKKVLTI